MFVPRTLAERELALGRGPLARALLVTLLLTAALTAILTLNVTPGQVTLSLGSIAPAELKAPRAMTFESSSLTEAKRADAAAKVAPVYSQVNGQSNSDIAAAQLRAFDSLTTQIASLLTERDAGKRTGDALTSAISTAAGDRLTEQEIAMVAGMTRARWEADAKAARAAVAQLQAGPIKRDELSTAQQDARAAVTSELGAADRQLAGDLAASFIAPNLEFNQNATAQQQQAARDAIQPVTVSVLLGEVIVRSGDRITPLAFEKLDKEGLTRPRIQTGTVIGNGLLALLMAILVVAFLWRFQPRIWHRNRSLLLFVLALVVTAVAIQVAADKSIWTYAVPTSATVLLIGILLEGYAGAAMAAALAVVAGLVNPNSGLEPALYVLTGGMTALVSIVRAERLNAFLRAGFLIALSNILVVTGFGLIEGKDAAGLLQLAGAGAVNAFLSVVLAVGSFAMLGNLFGIMTVFQLLELANPSNRLLRRLLLETPGTYHHAVMVGNLGERAAETIGADPLLVRVAAYYHDIGKMKNPLAFIENQAGAGNIHDELDAETSARIIAAHVRDGIDLGYENGLPVQVIGFIPQHHGTSVMSYFYGKALREAGTGANAVVRDKFRYPGPIPQSREAAILMLADGVEASVRSLESKDEASIRAMVDSIVEARLEDGQLDDAELTMKNISQIKEAFVQQLLGMYHSRIQYPDNVLPLEQRRESGGSRPA